MNIEDKNMFLFSYRFADLLRGLMFLYLITHSCRWINMCVIKFGEQTQGGPKNSKTEVRSFNMEIFIKAQFSVVQMSS